MKKLIYNFTFTLVVMNLIMGWGSAFASIESIKEPKEPIKNGTTLKLQDDIIFAAGETNKRISYYNTVTRESVQYCNNLGTCHDFGYDSGLRWACSVEPKESPRETRIIPKYTLMTLSEVSHRKKRHYGDEFVIPFVPSYYKTARTCEGQVINKSFVTMKANFRNARGKERSLNILCEQRVYYLHEVVSGGRMCHGKPPLPIEKIPLDNFINFNRKTFSLHLPSANDAIDY